MEAEVRSYEFSEDRSLYDRLYQNNQGSLLLKFFEYLFQGEIIYLRGRLLISGGDIFICLCYSCVICLLPSVLSDRKFMSFIYVFVIIKKGEIVRTRFVLIIILSFDDNNVYEFCLKQCGTLIECNFHFRKYKKSMHKISARSTDSEGSSMQHQNMLSQDIRRWSSRIKTWSIEASEELEIRSRSTEVLMVSR